MCLFRRKNRKEIILNSKFHIGDKVGFHYRNELELGYVYEIHQIGVDKYVYDIQKGGECPVIIKNIEEGKIHIRK